MFGKPASTTANNIMGLYTSPSKPLVDLPPHLAPAPSSSSSKLTSLIKTSLVGSVVGYAGYLLWCQHIVPMFGSPQAVGRWLWEGEEPPIWRWQRVCADVEKRLVDIEKRAGEMEGSLAEACKKVQADTVGSASYAIEQRVRRELSGLSHDVDVIASEVDVVKGAKGSEIRIRKKAASDRIGAVGKLVDGYMDKVEGWK